MFFEPESEHSAASVCEGFAVAGGRVTNFTSGQGLVLMKEVLYTISGKRLPVVMNIGARALTSQGLNVHAGHDDVMSVADVGWGMIFARNAQEAGDFCLISRRAAEATQTPFFNVQDGFLTTHTVETVRLPEPEFMKEYIGSPKEKLINLMDPANPLMSGRGAEPGLVHEGQDRPALVLRPHRRRPWKTPSTSSPARPAGKYGYIEPYRCEDADYILVGMGCYMETAKATVDYLREKKGVKAGCLTVFVFRPFPARQIVDALKNCQAFTVFERMDDPLSTTGNHLTREIKAAFCDAMTGQNGQEKIARVPQIYHGAAGPGQPRRAAGRHHRRLPQHADRRAGLLLRRHRPPAGAEAGRGPGPAADGRVLDARPLGRRLRLRDDEQGDRDHRRQRVRQGRAGVPEVRLREEGPADDLLPDHRRDAHQHALASWRRSSCCASTTRRRSSAR